MTGAGDGCGWPVAGLTEVGRAGVGGSVSSWRWKPAASGCDKEQEESVGAHAEYYVIPSEAKHLGAPTEDPDVDDETRLEISVCRSISHEHITTGHATIDISCSGRVINGCIQDHASTIQHRRAAERCAHASLPE